MTVATMRRAALAAAENVPVFPCWWTVDGVCACRDGALCGNPGKHPIPRHGFKAATQGTAKLRRWWRRYPRANPAMPTGKASGYVVLDVEPKYGRPNLPPTLVVRTGNGEHHWFRWPGHRCPNRQIKAHGIDVLRGDGGYVLLPGAVHASGRVYRKVRPGPVARFPAQLLDHKPPRRGKTGVRRTGLIPEGQRNDVLFDLGASMRARGVRRPGLRAALLAINEDQCNPPLAEPEVLGIVRSVCVYEAGTLGVARYPRIDRLCPVCGGPAAATFKYDRLGRPAWIVGCFGACSANGSYLPDLGEHLGLGRAADKEQIVLRWAERGMVGARLPSAVDTDTDKETV